MQIILAVIVDLLFGDPRVKWHPVRLIGNLANIVEDKINQSSLDKKSQGILATIAVLGVCLILVNSIENLLDLSSSILAWSFGVVVIWVSLSIKDLTQHAKAVFLALEQNDLDLARKNVALIVSRDTNGMSEEDIIKACIESVSENFSDSIVAPIFYGVIFGPLGAVGFRVINTLDAMWGYKTEKYLDFGRFAAKFDDLLGFIPSRLGAVIICSYAAINGMDFKSCWKLVLRDCQKHPSPNSGYCETAMAASLKVQLGGDCLYHGQVVNRDTLGDNIEKLDREKILSANQIIYSSVAYLLISLLPIIFLKWIIF